MGGVAGGVDELHAGTQALKSPVPHMHLSMHVPHPPQSGAVEQPTGPAVPGDAVPSEVSGWEPPQAVNASPKIAGMRNRNCTVMGEPPGYGRAV